MKQSDRRSRFSQSRTVNQMTARVRREQRDLLIRAYFETLNCPKSLMCWMLYKYDEHRQLVQLSIDPISDYADADVFKNDYAAVRFLSKCVGLKTGIDLKEVALRSAEEAEALCRTTNLVSKAITTGHASDLYSAVQYRAMQIVAKVLGPIPDSFEDVGWSAGRSSSASGEWVTGYHKYQSNPDVTVRASRDALQALRDSPWWGSAVLNTEGPVSVLPSALTIVGGNTLITVPKSAKTDRVICYEPHMNIRLQLQVGSYIRGRLRRAGVNLSDQSINQRRAKLGSKYGKLATIDLKSASDTLAREIVYELLPIDWALKLDDLRSPCTTWPDGSVRINEKFSSMGNGYTFELESLIFYALASAVTSDVSVYGDDIICPTTSFEEVCRTLRAFGFQTNNAKSFGSGMFRESCGGDYFGGCDVTPVYLRKLPSCTEDVVKLHNQVRRFSSTGLSGLRKWNDLMRKWRYIHPAFTGPSGYGDGHYHTNQDEADYQVASSHRKMSGWEGWTFATRVAIVRPEDELSHYGAAICVGTGPKRAKDLLSSAYKRRVKHVTIRGLCHEWQDVTWV